MPHPLFQNRRYWRDLGLFALLAALIGALTIIASFSYQGAQSYLHPPRAAYQANENPAYYGAGYQSITLVTEDAIELACWYTPTQNGALILVAHGYGGMRSAALHAMLARHGYGVLSWDARAHGESGGEISTWGAYEKRDVAAALKFAANQSGIENIGGLGQSMGAVTLIEAAADQPQLAALVLDSPFPAIAEMLARVVPSPIFRPGLRIFIQLETGLSIEDLRPIAHIPTIQPRPVFFIQGEADSTIPADSAMRLYAAAGEPRALWTEPGVEHVSMFTTYPDEYEQQVVAFFDSHLLSITIDP